MDIIVKPVHSNLKRKQNYEITKPFKSNYKKRVREREKERKEEILTNPKQFNCERKECVMHSSIALNPNYLVHII